jgi:uncharacterized membrane protein
MQRNPLFSSKRILIAGILLYIITTAALTSLLAYYGGMSIAAATVDSAVFITLLAAGGVATFFFFKYLRVWQAQTIASFAIISICLSVCFAGVALSGLEDVDTFIRTLPLRLFTGCGSWTILMQWYRIRIYAGEQQAKEEQLPPPTAPPAPLPPQPPVEYLDRISVRDAGRIHIVPINELLYIQASGDYATLFTPAGQFIKEQTMKYFDTHLPPATFVRIHRSTIVNTGHILRVELFGKDSYNVRLKNGVNLRASLAGYRLLKERLNL